MVLFNNLKMNTLRISRWLLLGFLLSLPVVRATPATTNTTLITFDDLVDGEVVPNGYAGLQWSDFDVISDQNPFAIDGYQTGVVSPDNVVFNPYGEPATISSSSNKFDLISVYLTAAVIPTMQIEVQGFDGINLPYDEIVYLNTNGPQLVILNYLGVSRVKFIPVPGSQFVMDNLLVRQPSLLAITNSHPIDLGLVEVPSVGHTYTPVVQPIPLLPVLPGPPIPSPVEEYQVTDFLVDQLQESGGGGVTTPVNANFDTNNQFTLTIAAPPGKKFHVHVPAGQSVNLNAYLDWQASNPYSYPGEYGRTEINFTDLEGVAPGYYEYSSFLSGGDHAFAFGPIYSMAITNDLSFSSITLLATVPNTNIGPGLLSYTPFSDNALEFYYVTTQTNDPGPFITLDSTNTVPVVPSTNLITFDDLPDMTFVPNGYGGLQWNNFEVISKSDRWAQDGYQVGIVSPSNEVFNPYGAPGSISSGTKFDLVSAYLTAAVLPRLQIEVQGFANGALTYDQTYPLTTNSPNFITFNYSGVDSVKFITTPPSQFAMDNLTVVINGTTNVTFQPVNLGEVQVPSIGHVFSIGLPIWPPGSPVPLTSAGAPAGLVLPFPLERVVRDYLIDQSQISNGGGVVPSVTADFDGRHQFVLKITAPAGKRFVVNVPANRSVTLDGQLDWQGPNVLSNGPSEYGKTAISFDGLEGTAPDFVVQSAVLSQLHGFFGFDGIQSMTFSNDISFTSITLTATVADTEAGSGTLNYTPLSGDALSFYYSTTQTHDPGPFVSLVSSGPVPVALGLAVAPASVSISAASDGTLVITFSGTLQSAAGPNGRFVDVPSNPQETYTIPKDSLGAQQFFRAR
jgi:hypothetical protein